MPADAVAVAASRSGYLQAVEADDLLALAIDWETVVWLLVRPGDFVTRGGLLAHVSPPPRDVQAVERRLNQAVVLGADRSVH